MKHKIDDKQQSVSSHEQPAHFDSWYDKERLQQSKAIVVGVYKKADEEVIAKDHLDELELLAKTHKIPVVGRWCTHVRGFSAATFLTSGKVEQLREEALLCGANLVIFDDEISAAQQKNLEQALRLPVMDRTEVILGVFADRAKTREAKLQIEVAQIRYLSPRLKRMWTHLSRQHVGGGSTGGGGGYLRGTGEKQIEVDRRILKRRLERLESELHNVERNRHTQRSRREKSQIPVFAIVGYTNAGKSTLLNRLTSAHVLVEDMLFATLDTTTRLFCLPTKQQILLVDTVGFIRKLPHLLVAAFKSTLEEAVDADVLIHLVDSSHPQALEQAQTTLEVLAELNAKDRPIITVINKVDLAATEAATQQRSMIQKLRLAYPRSVQLSALTGEGIDDLFHEMELMIKNRRMRTMLKIPQSEYHVLASSLAEGVIHHREYVENDLIIDVELPISDACRLAAYAVSQPPQEEV
jgi:GTP-binding protein HflX